jgi:prophage antirepressor-like protein
MTEQNIMPFSYGEQEIRVITDEQGNPWWVAKDVCTVLGITNPTQAVQQLDDDERAMQNIGRQRAMNVINESGLYTLILRSNKPAAKPFRKWVTAEVLPAIRRTGFYQQPEAARKKKPDSLLPIAREFRAALRLTRGMGFQGTQAVYEACCLVRKQTGVDPLELLDSSMMAEQTQKRRMVR